MNTKNEIIKRANKIHKNKFDYSKLEYITYHSKSTITCPIHGDFLQTIHNHLAGCGCPACGRDITNNFQRSNVEEFIEKSKKYHGNRYDYSAVDYINANLKIKIICKLHGEFSQIPNAHVRGQGCPKCNSKRSTSDKFILLSKKIHNDKYNYSNVNYLNNYTKVEIICPHHGVFLQIPRDHLYGAGCIKCRGRTLSILYADTKEQFIEKSKKIHGGKFIYDNVIYKNCHNNVIITCKKHGDFSQSPSSNLRGNGCPVCRSSKGELKIITFLEMNNIKYQPQKTFDTCKNPKTNYKLRYDFYVPSKNLLIEYDGKQHFEHGGYIGKHRVTTVDLNDLKYKDKIKTKYARNNGIDILRIKYTKFNQIEKILRQHLTNLTNVV